MELQQITLVAVLAVLILQVITISLIAGKKKQGQGRVSGDVKRPGGDIRGEKKDGGPRRESSVNRKPAGDNRSGGNRPQQQSRPQQSQPAAAAIDPMEKSLRDINLRLKNAEREQENARKKFQESGSGGGKAEGNRDGRPQYQRNDRGGNRNDRGGGNGGGSGGNRDFNRDRPKDNRPPEKPYRAEQEAPAFSPPETPQPAVTAPPPPDIAVNDIGVSEELQHGRKFTAKRRQLPSDAAQESDAPEFDAPATEQQFTESAPPEVQTEQQTDGADIQFGRR